MRPLKLLSAAAVAASLTACAVMAPTYVPPTPNTKVDYTRVIAVPFDEAWSAMIDYVSTTSFSITSFEKDSGLLTLSFGESDVPRYVECGTWDGQPYIERDLGFRLNGRMNIRIKDLGGNKTSIRVSTSYRLRGNSGTVYSFRENEPATVEPKNRAEGTLATRTCQSTQAAERKIITGIDALASK